MSNLKTYSISLLQRALRLRMAQSLGAHSLAVIYRPGVEKRGGLGFRGFGSVLVKQVRLRALEPTWRVRETHKYGV